MASGEEPRNTQEAGLTTTCDAPQNTDRTKSSDSDLGTKAGVGEDIKDGAERASSHSGNGDESEKKKQGPPDNGTVERSRAKIAVIMLALGVRRNPIVLRYIQCGFADMI